MIKRPSGTRTTRRVNISLSEQTLRLLSRVSRGNRSRFIDEAIHHLVATQAKTRRQHRLRDGYLRNRQDSLHLAEEWFPLEEEVWPEKT